MGSDLNSIERMWPELTVKVTQRSLTNPQELELAVINEWNNIPAEVYLNHIKNYRERLLEDIKVKGHVVAN